MCVCLCRRNLQVADFVWNADNFGKKGHNLRKRVFVIVIFFELLLLMPFVAARDINHISNLDGDWKVVSYEMPGVGGLSERITERGLKTTIKIRHNIFNPVFLGDGFIHKIDFGSKKEMRAEECDFFKPNEKGTLDFRTFKLGQRGLLFNVINITGTYSELRDLLFDDNGNVMDVDWDNVYNPLFSGNMFSCGINVISNRIFNTEIWIETSLTKGEIIENIKFDLSAKSSIFRQRDNRISCYSLGEIYVDGNKLVFYWDGEYFLLERER